MRSSSLDLIALNAPRPKPAPVEREHVLSALHRGLSRARGGKRAMLMLTGSAGLGKTTALERFVAEIEGDLEMCIARGECVEHYGAGEPYLPLLDGLSRLARCSGTDVVSILGRYAPLWLQQLPGLLDVAAQTELQARIQHAAPSRMLREITEALEVMATNRTLVLTLEDLHWCDPSTCSLLMFLAKRREPARLLIVGTLRADEAPDHVKNMLRELRAHEWSTELPLQPLSAAGVQAYLQARFEGGPCDPGLAERLHRRTGGHPLFLVQMLESLLREGALERHDGCWRLAERAASTADAVPETLRDLALQRIGSLAPELQALVEVASVAGTEFCAAELAAALGLELEEAERHCSELLRNGALLESAGVVEWPDETVAACFRFAHALLREAIYDALEEGRRVRLHRQLGQLLEQRWGERAGEIAAVLRLHFEAGRDPARALAHAERAAELSMARHAPHEAIEHLNAALALLAQSGGDPSRELGLRTMLGSALVMTRGWTAEEVLDNYTRALELDQSTCETYACAAVLRGLLSCYQVSGMLGRARVHADKLLALYAGQRNPAAVQAHTGQLALLFAQADYERLLHHASEALAGYRFEDRQEHAARFGGLDPAVSALSWSALALWMLGFPEAATSASRLALRVVERIEDPFSGAFGRHMAATLRQLTGCEDEARTLSQVAVDLAERENYPFFSTLTSATFLALNVIPRDPRAGLPRLREVVKAHEANGVRLALPNMLALLSAAELRAGDAAAAVRTIEQAVDVADRTNQISQLPPLYLQHAAIALEIERGGSRAESWFARALETAHAQRALGFELRAATGLASLYLQRGLPERARDVLLPVYQAFDEGFTQRDLQAAEAVLQKLGQAGRSTAPSPARERIARELAILLERGHALCSANPSEPVARPWPVPPTTPERTEAPAPPSARARFVLEGDYWTLEYAGRVCRMKDARGMGLIARLLACPHREIHVLNLSAEPEGDTDLRGITRALARTPSSEGLDRRARSEYEARAEALAAELEQAQAHNDLGRVQALQQELQFLTKELSRAFGLGGRPRAAGTPSERARVNVTRAIKSVVRRIADHHPELGEHLSVALRTGTFCCYAPDPGQTLAWQIQASA